MQEYETSELYNCCQRAENSKRRMTSRKKNSLGGEDWEGNCASPLKANAGR